jgi:formate dehydrogenase (NADP+) beta subunit
MQPTDTSQPDYFHKVVDCQWACPAHTDVPEYIRLIAQGRFTDAYLINRASNVFPGILGRVCDRPCEPACRRGRVEKKPVAICRLKRVAADHKDEFLSRLPAVPKIKNGKKIALVGAGCASLTVANDLMPLGYEVTIFEQWGEPGGLMRTNIPSFRLPQTVLNEEIGAIIGMGVDLRLNTPVKSLRALLDAGGYDAVFVGSGAPKGKDLELPGRRGTERIHIGIDWLESVAFGHVEQHRASACSSSAWATRQWTVVGRRCGWAPTSVKVMARKPRAFFKASDWELKDAEEEHVEIVVNHSPKAFVIEDGKLLGMMFDEARVRVRRSGTHHRRAA